MLVLSPGSKLLLTCRGHVKVDGETVSVVRNPSNSSRRAFRSYKQTMEGRSEENHSSPTEIHENRVITLTDPGYTASPTTQVIQKSSVSELLKGQYNWETQDMNGEDAPEEEDGDEGSRVTRAVKFSHHWKWSGKTGRKGDRDWGEVTFEERGATLYLPAVREADSGKYACFYKGREMFSVRVTVAGEES